MVMEAVIRTRGSRPSRKWRNTHLQTTFLTGRRSFLICRLISSLFGIPHGKSRVKGALIRGGITEMRTCMERYRFFIDPQIKSVHVWISRSSYRENEMILREFKAFSCMNNILKEKFQLKKVFSEKILIHKKCFTLSLSFWNFSLFF